MIFYSNAFALLMCTVVSVQGRHVAEVSSQTVLIQLQQDDACDGSCFTASLDDIRADLNDMTLSQAHLEVTVYDEKASIEDILLKVIIDGRGVNSKYLVLAERSSDGKYRFDIRPVIEKLKELRAETTRHQLRHRHLVFTLVDKNLDHLQSSAVSVLSKQLSMTYAKVDRERLSVSDDSDVDVNRVTVARYRRDTESSNCGVVSGSRNITSINPNLTTRVRSGRIRIAHCAGSCYDGWLQRSLGLKQKCCVTTEWESVEIPNIILVTSDGGFEEVTVLKHMPNRCACVE